MVERGARASVIESYVTLAPDGVYWTNPVTEVAAAAGSWLEHTRIQRESERAYHVALTHVDQQRDSHYRSFSMAMGGALARHNLHVRLNDENIETLMYGLYLTRGDQVVDNHTAIFHDQPNCRSWEVYKGVLDGRSRAVFNGKVFVQPEAQKTDAKQTNRNLLLSDLAKVDTKPQLEIFADDVKCTHGATVGRLDDVALFYARSRGVPAGGGRAAPDLRLRGGGDRGSGAGAGAQRARSAGAGAAGGRRCSAGPRWRRPRTAAVPSGWSARCRGSAPTSPSSSQRVRDGRPLVYLDNAATSQKPRAVIDAISRFYACENANIHRGLHYLSERATAAYDAAREQVARFLGAESASEIVFTRGDHRGDQPGGAELGPDATSGRATRCW